MMLFEDFFWDRVGRKRRATAGELCITVLMMLFEDIESWIESLTTSTECSEKNEDKK